MPVHPPFYFPGEGVGEIFLFKTAQVVRPVGLYDAPPVVVIEGRYGIFRRIVKPVGAAARQQPFGVFEAGVVTRGAV